MSCYVWPLARPAALHGTAGLKSSSLKLLHLIGLRDVVRWGRVPLSREMAVLLVSPGCKVSLAMVDGLASAPACR